MDCTPPQQRRSTVMPGISTGPAALPVISLARQVRCLAVGISLGKKNVVHFRRFDVSLFDRRRLKPGRRAFHGNLAQHPAIGPDGGVRTPPAMTIFCFLLVTTSFMKTASFNSVFCGLDDAHILIQE